MCYSLDPDQARHFVWPDLGPNCLQGLSADDKCRQGVNVAFCLLHRPVGSAVTQS